MDEQGSGAENVLIICVRNSERKHLQPEAFFLPGTESILCANSAKTIQLTDILFYDRTAFKTQTHCNDTICNNSTQVTTI